jgi:hypothetical protein
MTNYNFEVETIEAGQRQSYGDSYYSYKVTSERPEYEVKDFCMKVLRKSHELKDMPNPFAGKLLEFKKITDNNKGKGFLDTKVAETYSYKLKTEYTG